MQHQFDVMMSFGKEHYGWLILVGLTLVIVPILFTDFHLEKVVFSLPNSGSLHCLASQSVTVKICLSSLLFLFDEGPILVEFVSTNSRVSIVLICSTGLILAVRMLVALFPSTTGTLFPFPPCIDRVETNLLDRQVIILRNSDLNEEFMPAYMIGFMVLETYRQNIHMSSIFLGICITKKRLMITINQNGTQHNINAKTTMKSDLLSLISWTDIRVSLTPLRIWQIDGRTFTLCCRIVLKTLV